MVNLFKSSNHHGTGPGNTKKGYKHVAIMTTGKEVHLAKKKKKDCFEGTPSRALESSVALLPACATSRRKQKLSAIFKTVHPRDCWKCGLWRRDSLEYVDVFVSDTAAVAAICPAQRILGDYKPVWSRKFLFLVLSWCSYWQDTQMDSKRKDLKKWIFQKNGNKKKKNFNSGWRRQQTKSEKSQQDRQVAKNEDYLKTS